jgi:hypothetical protein
MAAAGWYPDPEHVHDARYWDGGEWTDRALDGGVVVHDDLTRPGAPPPARSRVESVRVEFRFPRARGARGTWSHRVAHPNRFRFGWIERAEGGHWVLVGRAKPAWLPPFGRGSPIDGFGAAPPRRDGRSEGSGSSDRTTAASGMTTVSGGRRPGCSVPGPSSRPASSSASSTAIAGTRWCG